MFDFSNLPEDQQKYANLGLLGLMVGSGILGAGGQGQTGFGQIGSGVGQGLLGYSQMQNAMAQHQLRQLQMAEAKRKQQQQEAQRAAMARLFEAPNPQLAMASGETGERAGPTPQAAARLSPPIAQMFPGSDVSALRNYAEAYPEQFGTAVASRMLPKQQEAFTLGEGQVRYGPDGRVVAEGPKKQPPPTEFERAMQAAGLQPGTPAYQKAAMDYVQRKGLPPQITTQVDMRQDTEEAKVVGRNFGEIYAGLIKSDLDAPSRLAKLQRLNDVLDQVNTGKFAGTALEIKRTAKAAGIDLEALGIRDDVAPAQAAQALSREMALELRNPQGGAGMPGALSDRDRDFLESMVPGIEMDPAGRKIIIEARSKLIQREREVAKMARAYRRKNGALDEGFFDELAAYADKNPLFSDMTPPKPSAKPPLKGQVVDGYRFKGGNPADPNSWEKAK